MSEPSVEGRCGLCKNCQELERVKARVMAVVTKSSMSASVPTNNSADAAELWNQELERLPCLGSTPCTGDCWPDPCQCDRGE
jgi:hypothetical protein